MIIRTRLLQASFLSETDCPSERYERCQNNSRARPNTSQSFREHNGKQKIGTQSLSLSYKNLEFGLPNCSSDPVLIIAQSELSSTFRDTEDPPICSSYCIAKPIFVAEEELLGCAHNMFSAKQRKTCLQWVAMTEFDLYGPPGKAIETNLHRFCRVEPLHDIYTAVGDLFTVADGTAERWPRIVRALLCQASHDAWASFETWERPQDIDKRERGSSIWSSMLAFIVAYWTYDAGHLKEMGLFLSDDVQSAIDDIHYWCETGGNIGRILGAARQVFLKAIMDRGSPKTNPMLWWLVVLIKSELLVSRLEFPAGGSEKHSIPALSFDGQLKALNHYARVLTLESFLQDWKSLGTTRHGFEGDLLRTRDEICAFVQGKSGHWIDEADDRTFQRLLSEKSNMNSQAWRHILGLLHSLVDAWLVQDCYGPVREIMHLLDGRPVPRGDERYQDLVLSGTQPSSSPQLDQYQVITQCWEFYTERQRRDGRKVETPITSSQCLQSVYRSAMEANEKARDTIAAIVGQRFYAKRWDEQLRDDGTVQIRAVYVDPLNNAKIVSWVKKFRA